MAITDMGHLYFWGKLPNAPRGEATMYVSCPPARVVVEYDYKSQVGSSREASRQGLPPLYLARGQGERYVEVPWSSVFGAQPCASMVAVRLVHAPVAPPATDLT